MGFAISSQNISKERICLREENGVKGGLTLYKQCGILRLAEHANVV